ncbi:MAG: hypothetical protein CME65_08365 [Halobacteriovoraceae bacterium]|nr:hypothetical protein [Halobacteriovoraceae bacterium]|tara:strand:- start:3169 stop:3591 length:423 start_codon:yes stop_codon:yes gene_type:complete
MKISILILLGFLTTQVFAQRNPQIRVCLQNGGNFWSMDITSPRVDTIGFCRYDQSLLGSISMMNYFFYANETQAVRGFLSSETSISSCSTLGAMTVDAMDSTGMDWELCLFRDGSFIEKETLLRGLHSPINRRLREALTL